MRNALLSVIGSFLAAAVPAGSFAAPVIRLRAMIAPVAPPAASGGMFIPRGGLAAFSPTSLKGFRSPILNIGAPAPLVAELKTAAIAASASQPAGDEGAFAQFSGSGVSGSPVKLADVYAATLDRRGTVEHATRGGAYLLLLRRGTDNFNREVLVVDILDLSAEARGTVAHIDLAVNSGMNQASLDGPLDSWVADAPAEFSKERLDHWREHLWFGLSVLPEYRGQGLGLLLLDVSLGLLRTRGVGDLHINATENSAAFYERHLRGRIAEAEPYTGEDEAEYVHFRVTTDP